MLIVFTGDGKGKTTAALGQMARVAGNGKRALMIQFIKGPWKSGEDSFAQRFGIPPESFHIKKMGLGFVGILGDKLPRAKHAEAARKALMFFKKELKSNRWDLIALDEVNNAVALRLLSIGELLAALKNVPDEKIVACTGRDAHAKLVAKADMVTEMREIKHPFQNKKLAKILVEF